MSARLPVTVIGGFLGAGKTTLVNRLLAAGDAAGIAVLVNDFGAVNVDERLIRGREAEVLSLANGCLCCARQDDLVSQLARLVAERGGALRRIVIETSGVADPGRVLLTLGYPQLRASVHASGVATLLDATRFATLTGPARALADAQLAAADFAVLTKADLAAPEAVEALRGHCRALGIRCLRADEPALLHAALYADVGAHALRLAQSPPAAEAFESWSFHPPAPLRLAPLRAVLSDLPQAVYRAKGFVALAEVAGVCSVQAVGARVEIARAAGDAGDTPAVLVFIGLRGSVDWAALARRLEACATPPAAADSERPR